MAIESVPVALVPTKAAASVSVAVPGTGKPSAKNQAADKATKDFRNLLEGLETAVDVPADSALPASDGAVVAADAGTGLEKPLEVAEPTATSADAATWMAAYLSPVPVPLATPVASAAVSAPSGAMDAVQAASTPVAAVKPDVVGVPDTQAAATHLGAPAPSNSPAPAVVPDARTQSISLANYASVFEQIQSRLAASSTAAQDGAGPGSKGLAKPVLGTAAADARADQVASVARGSVWTLPVTEAAALRASTGATEAMQRALGETTGPREGLVAELAPDGGVGGVGHHPFTPTVQFESATASVDVSQPAPEAAVADQVSYWISQGIQNAELTFEGADAQPVQVSISLSGNEAHVEFRTDQLETRDLLTGSAAHLKDLLQSEGMVLSGLSVGSSGAGGTNARERRAPSEAPQNTARPGPEVAAVRPTAPQGSSGRSVDLFV
nr:flagellar hook-length control protein FliK [uncultured Albidiferax sp.]